MDKKIAVIGISGSGKSTFSRKLAEKTGLPLFYMDQLFWKGSWEAIPESEYLKNHQELIRKDAWIIEGFVDAKMADRLKSADLVLYLDYSGLRCAYRLVMRWLEHRKESRPELPKEALEALKIDFVWMVFNRGERKDIEEAISASNPANLQRLTSPRQLKRFMKNHNFK